MKKLQIQYKTTHLDPKIWNDLKSSVFFFIYIHIATLQQEVQLSNMAAACTIAQLTDYSATCGACDLGSQIRNIIGITMGTHIFQKARSHPKIVDARRET